MRYDSGQKSPEDIKAMILKSLDSDKALDVQTIDLRGQSALADFIIVASGTSSRHVSSIAEKLSKKLHASGVGDVHSQGLKTSDWVVVDAGDVIVHVFKPEVRSFYAIEKMWQTTHPSIEVIHA